MKKFYAYTLFIYLFIALFTFVSCSTSQISVNKQEMKKIKTVAIMKFDTAESINKQVAKDCEESFKGHFISIQKKVVERDKLDAILKEIEKSHTGIYDNPIEIGRISGADALLFGEVTEYKEEVRRVKYNEYDKKTKKNIEKEKDKKFFTFQVNIRLVSTTDGNVILTLKNKYPESSYEMTDSTTLVRYRERVLNQMGEDLKKALEEN